jgi:hypothetical protein
VFINDTDVVLEWVLCELEQYRAKVLEPIFSVAANGLSTQQ